MTQTVVESPVARESPASLAIWPVLRLRTTTLAASVGVHLAVLALVTSTWRAEQHVQEPSAPTIPVVMFRAAPPALPSPAPRAPQLEPRRERAKKRALIQPSPKPSPEPETASEAPELTEIEQEGDAAASSSAGLASAPGNEATGGAPRGQPTLVDAPPASPLSPAQRKVYLDRYLQEIFRSRIAARFYYPEQAERLGIEGLVVMRVSVLSSGALLHAKVMGECPHRILCEAAERTVQQAAPFPPPPAELGGAIAVAVPLQYRLE